jgi:hypothetical protein
VETGICLQVIGSPCGVLHIHLMAIKLHLAAGITPYDFGVQKQENVSVHLPATELRSKASCFHLVEIA